MVQYNAPSGAKKRQAEEFRMDNLHHEGAPGSSSRKEELRSFLFLSVVMGPIIAGIVVAGYGFLVWIYQIIAGPPGA